MWSLGCMAAFMYLGTPLYPGRSEYDMITYIVETQGQPPDNMLNHGLRTIKFFQKDNSWTLKTPEQFYRETGIQLMDNRRNKFTSLDDLQHFSAAGEETNNVTMFVVMLKGMLQLDGTKRMTPCQVLDHQFINCASSCSKMIDIDQNKKQTFDNRKTRSLQQPPTRTAKPIQLNPHDLNKRSDNDRKMFQKTSAGPSTSSCSSQTQSCSFPKVKRKMTHGKDSDSSHDKRSDNEKKIDRKWDAVEARSTCSSHRDSTHSLHVQANQRSSLAKDHRPSPRSSSSTWAERQAPIGLKRKSSDEGDMQPGKRTSGPWSDNGRKRFQKTSAGPSTSSCSSQTQSCSFPKVKRKMTHGKDSDSSHDKRSDNEKKIGRKWYAVVANSTCRSHRDSTHSLHVQANQRSSLAKDHRPSPRSSSSTWAERQAPIGLKRKSSDEGDVQPGKRTSGPWSDNGRKRFQNSAGQSTSSCSSSSKGLAKVVSADQTPSKGNGSSSYPCSTNTPKRPKAPTKPILTSDLKFRKKIQAIMKERKRHCQGSKRHAH
ncbi:dual specificity tyrosine-phosphorylation-regulated kinase mbk-1-like [Paralichthys olivaceus]|uniref:dual specificity tyrosine-phosphorylation-regulated kinase mbk-1-like n=1 Tax=Paralichthys olivaceus TaxID=8255 RepID=UPI003753A46D